MCIVVYVYNVNGNSRRNFFLTFPNWDDGLFFCEEGGEGGGGGAKQFWWEERPLLLSYPSQPLALDIFIHPKKNIREILNE